MSVGSGERDASSVREAVRAYRLLTRLLPGALYRDFGRDMVADFSVLARAAHARGGAIGVSRALFGAAWDVGRGGIGEWWVERFVRRPATVSGVRAERVRMGDEMVNWLQEFRLAARSLAQRPGLR